MLGDLPEFLKSIDPFHEIQTACDECPPGSRAPGHSMVAQAVSSTPPTGPSDALLSTNAAGLNRSPSARCEVFATPFPFSL